MQIFNYTVLVIIWSFPFMLSICAFIAGMNDKTPVAVNFGFAAGLAFFISGFATVTIGASLEEQENVKNSRS